MAIMKFIVVSLVMVAIVLQSGVIECQPTCSASLSNLNVCAPFVVPGTANPSPSADCCSALQSVDHECFCNTLRISARLPSLCNLPPLSCAAN
ncbi:hypothetical protein RND71_018373 [Anisodus tanguticus]|uniref:Bifunctional inhibitor/plant lipid transfer protein/seed storage helical domain-containing protein n=1 Tax=Anisodus tanguticus TaxID=243964 RepID=A0AAE1S4N8_9SOLA|nr:hypothetical protein RND71_018373 [Anisodus tanguticus]